VIAGLFSCEKGELKENQWISFEDIPLQKLMDNAYVLTATASSGLPVTFTGNDSRVVSIEGNIARFLSTGAVYITAHQEGNARFHEAPAVTRKIVIKDWDPDKLDQTISFELISVQRVSESEMVELNATASSGLPVSFTSSDEKAGIVSGNTLILQHSYTGATFDTTIQITAWQEGDEAYNPAENVVRDIRVIGDVIHK
jgi:hypothetical protein